MQRKNYRASKNVSHHPPLPAWPTHQARCPAALPWRHVRRRMGISQPADHAGHFCLCLRTDIPGALATTGNRRPLLAGALQRPDRLQHLRRSRLARPSLGTRHPKLRQENHFPGGDSPPRSPWRGPRAWRLQLPHSAGCACVDRAPYAICSSLPADAVTATASGTRSILVLCGLGRVHQGHEPDRAAFRADADVPLTGTLSGQRRAGIIATVLSFQPARHSHRILPQRGARSANQLAKLEYCTRHGPWYRPTWPCFLSTQQGRICGCVVTDKANIEMPSDDIAISVRNLSKSYRLFNHPGDRIKQFFSLGLKQYHREFSALKDVSFDIIKGETVGIIGRNGSGKEHATATDLRNSQTHLWKPPGQRTRLCASGTWAQDSTQNLLGGRTSIFIGT